MPVGYPVLGCLFLEPMGSEVDVRILGKGATGFLASSLMDMLVECGDEVRVIVCK